MSENIGKQENREIVRSPFKADEEQPYIFISYSHKDRERVFPIIKHLYEQGWRIWYDEGLEIATNYLATLSQHIKNCAAFLLFVTENSVKSDFVCENELIVASNNKKIIVQCVLDEAAQFSGEAKDVIDIVTASRKHPVTDDASLEAALESIEGLTRGERRTAKGITITSRGAVAEDDKEEYLWEPCDGGVRLIRYRGKDEEVHIPAEYPAASGQAVVELSSGITFFLNAVLKVWIPKTVKWIGDRLLGSSCHPTDIYIPSGVEEISPVAFVYGNTENLRIHCAEDSEAHRYALEFKLNFVFDESLRVKKVDEVPYAYCSYAPDVKGRVDEILEKLTAAGCEVRDSGAENGVQRMGMLNHSRCFIAFISREYITDGYIEELMFASNSGKKLTMYVLEDCTMPLELELAHPADQQLRYNELTEKERTAKLVEWLGINGCRGAVFVPDFVSQETREGITLLKYTGSGRDVVIEREYGGIPVTTIGRGAFEGCSGLTTVTIPDSVTEIGDEAFWGCNGLTSVAIPDSVSAIGVDAFHGCTALCRIDVSENNEHYTSVDGVLYSKDIAILLAYPNRHNSTYFVPDSVTEIGSGAFSYCNSLTSVTIPNGVTSIGGSAFYGCSRLTSITIPDSVIKIGDSAFQGCSRLTLVTLPDSVTEIGDWTFSDCRRLTSVTIPDSVATIGKLAFLHCSGLTSITISDYVTEIGDGAFEGCSGLTSVTIPDSVIKIGDSAFQGCSRLTLVTLPNSVTTISYATFAYCSGLTSVTIPDFVTTIGEFVFSGCIGLTSVVVPNSVTEIGESAFYKCFGLSSVTIPDSVTEIGEYAFEGCPNITVYCSKDSCTWTYCEENNIPHKELTETPEPVPAEPCAAEPASAEEPVSAPAVESVTKPAEEPAPAKAPARRSSAWWLIPAALALALGGAAAVQLTGLFDILGAIGRLLG